MFLKIKKETKHSRIDPTRQVKMEEKEQPQAFNTGIGAHDSKGGVFQQESQATGGTRRQVESPTAANGKKTFGSTGHGVKGVFCTEVRTNDSVWGRRESRCQTERSGASRIGGVRVSE